MNTFGEPRVVVEDQAALRITATLGNPTHQTWARNQVSGGPVPRSHLRRLFRKWLPVRIGYRIIDPATGTILEETGRGYLTDDVPAVSETAAEVVVLLPPEDGAYRVVVSPLEEDVAWFYDEGGDCLEIEAVVESGAARIANARRATWADRDHGRLRLLRSALHKVEGLLSGVLLLLQALGLTQSAEDALEDARMKQELIQFTEWTDINQLPGIFHVWSDRYVRPKLEAVFEVSRFDDFYVKYILEYAAGHPGQTAEIASLGAGDGSTELELGMLLRRGGFTGFRFHCFDVNPNILATGRERAKAAGMQEYFRFERVNAANWHPEQPLAIVMAIQSLHHFVELEAIFANVAAAIGSEGYFLTHDMIGRNGHQRWPEALGEVERIWAEMPARYRYNHQLKREEKRFGNWDCSRVGFEGVRAQDVLPLLIQHFHFEAFVAYANIIDPFVDRGIGPNFDVHNPEDVAFIERVGARDEELLDSGVIKPTQIVAAMRAVPVAQPRIYRHWTPQFCVRKP